jgi:hypothetical protein
MNTLAAKAAEGTRTLDLVLTKDVLYQLSYSSVPVSQGEPKDMTLRKTLAASVTSSAKPQSQITKPSRQNQISKAGEGNRTLVFSLEGCGSTIELHPQTLDDSRNPQDE